MSRVDAWLLHVSNGLVLGSGLVYACMAYLLEPEDPYAIVGHPWQPHVQHLHVLVAPFFLLVLGYLWSRHMGPHLQRNTLKGRVSGLGMVLSALPMIFSGYAIQTAVEPQWRTLWVVVHLATSLLWMMGYLLHTIRKWAGVRSL